MNKKAHVVCNFNCFLIKWRTSQCHGQSRTLYMW